MTNEEKFEYWLDRVQYDLDSADVMYNGGRWTYVVFMCQQTVEKLVKGLHIYYTGTEAPKLHDINQLLSRFSDKVPIEIDQEKRDFFAVLTSYYLNNRYANYKEKLSAATDKQFAEVQLDKTKEIVQWLMTFAPSKD
ncbi:MAG: HEPN domain-containing protein [Planctomycetaceae bacterium]|jgi:HEPN domain-containing protein|nr:HEPN domain-containing protein [Planctomycetaceae bacterium]